MLSLTYADLKALNPCADSLKRVSKLMGGARKWGSKKINAAQAREYGVALEDIVWVAATIAYADRDMERRIRLWLADCAAHVLHFYEKSYPNDVRPRDAIITSRAYARSETGAVAWAAASTAARAAARAAVRAAASEAARAAVSEAANAAAWAEAWTAAKNTEEVWQFDRLILWLSDPEPTDYPIS